MRWYGVRASSDSIDLLVPANRAPRSAGFVVIHRTTKLPQFVCSSGPVRYALAARAVADAARLMHDLREVRAVVAGAVQRGQCTVEQLEVELKDGPRNGSALLRTVLAEVGIGVRSAPEGDLLDLIKRGRLPMPMMNPRVLVGKELIARPDAWWPEYGVAVEVDSKEWHVAPERWERTMTRHARMTALGILVLHFSPRQIRQKPDEVIATIRKALDSRQGHPKLAVRTLPAA